MHRDYEQFEYYLFSVIDELDGSIDVEEVWEIIDTKASEGWRLHSMLPHQDIKPVVSLKSFVKDDGTRVKETLLIFERRVKPEE